MSNKQNKPKPHIHAKLIKAWADGEKIQHFDTSAMQWKDCEVPNWFIQSQYRIKPKEPSARWKPKMGEEYTYLSFGDGFLEWKLWNDSQTDIGRYETGNCFRTEEEAVAAAERVRTALKGEVIPAKDYDKLLARPKEIEADLDVLRTSICNNSEIAEKSSVVEIDGKPLTDGEKELIRALRKVVICAVYDKDVMVVHNGDNGIRGVKHPVAFLTNNLLEIDEPIRVSLKKIQAEQEETK